MAFANEASWDRILRVIIGLGLIVLGATGVVSGAIGIILIVLGAILVLTGLVGFCPLYALFHIRTNQPVKVPVKR